MRVQKGLIVVMTLFAMPAFAGAVYDLEIKNLVSGEVKTGKISIEGGNLKIASPAVTDKRSADVIYRSSKREALLIDHAGKSFVVMDEAGMQAMGAQMSEGMRMLEEQMKNMPPEQRDAMRKMMQERGMAGGMPGSQPAREVKVVKGGPVSMRGQSGVQYDMFVNGEKTVEYWTTSPGKLRGGAELYALAKEMSGFFEKGMGPMMNSMRDAGANPYDVLDRLDGNLPFFTRRYQGGKAVEESFFGAGRDENIAASEFEPPPGYKKREMPKGPMGQPRK